jgi:hypothetical protein
MVDEPVKIDEGDGEGEPLFDGSLEGRVFDNGATIPADQISDFDDKPDPRRVPGRVVDPDQQGFQEDLVASAAEAQVGGGDARLSQDVERVLHGHYGNLSQIRSVLDRLATQGRTDYEIFRRLPSAAVTQPYLLEIIEKIGGKNFGDLMLEVFYGENEEEVADIREGSGFAEISTNRAFYVDTEVSREMEAISFDLLDDVGAIIERDFSGADIQYFNPELDLFKQYLFERVINFPQILELVDGVYAKLMDWDPNFNQGKYRLRGSMVYEDWLDTQVAGVSPSGRYVAKDSQRYIEANVEEYKNIPLLQQKLSCGDPCLWKFRLNFLLPYIEFIFHKQLSVLSRKRDTLEGKEKDMAGYARYRLEDDEQLGMQVAPEIDVQKHVVAVIDDENVVSMDLNLKSLESQDLLIRVMVDDMDRISVHYGFDTVKYGHPELGHDESEDPSVKPVMKPAYLSRRQILGIAKLMRLKKNFYGFNVDGEFCLDKENRLIDVQTRIAPDVVEMESDQEVDLRGYTKVAESVFGLGQKFAVKGKLLFLKRALGGMNPMEIEALVKGYGDLSKYILVLNDPLSNSLFGLQRLSFERQNTPAGVIDPTRGVALTHTPVQSGASNFFRENIPVMGMGANVGSLMDLAIDPKSFFTTSDHLSGEIIMVCDDGKTVCVYAEDDVARVLLPAFRKRRSDLVKRPDFEV